MVSGSASSEIIASWIESGDAKAMARLPGVGARAAELIIATLKGKCEDLAIGDKRSPADCLEMLQSEFPQYDEATLLAVAKSYQDATAFHLEHPPMFQ